MNSDTDRPDLSDWLTDLAESVLTSQELRPQLSARLESQTEVERALREIEIARRIRGLVFELRVAEVEVPAGFEARLMARVRADATLLDLVEMMLAGFGRALVEMLEALFGLLPAPARPEPAAV